jgi:hypothetical protein
MLEITRGLGIYRWRVRDDCGRTTEWHKHRKSVWEIVSQGELDGASYEVGEPGWTIKTVGGSQVGQAKKNGPRAVKVFAADGSVYDMLVTHRGLWTGITVTKGPVKLGEIKGATIGTVRCDLPPEVPLPIQFLMGWILHKIQIADGSVSSSIESSLEGLVAAV